MGLLFDLIPGHKKKRCTECGCIMPDDHDGEICEVCLDERGDTVSDSIKKELDL